MKELLIEEESGIQNSKIGIPLDIGNDLQLKGQRIGVGENHIVEFLYVDHYSAFLFALSIKLPNHKDRKVKWGMPKYELEAAKAMHLIKCLVNKQASFVS